jgi:hypothetical protein
MIFDTDDKAIASALSTIEGMLRTLELRGMLKGQTAADVRSRITGAGSLEIALAGAAHIQENVSRRCERRVMTLDNTPIIAMRVAPALRGDDRYAKPSLPTPSS